MKKLHQYLTESSRGYHYTIKILGDVESKLMSMFVHNLSKFDPVSISEPKSTPVQKDPYGFEGESNQPVTIVKAEFKYPATEPQIQQIAKLLGFNVNNIRVLSSQYNDSGTIDTTEKSPILSNELMPDGGKQASKDYANQYMDNLPKESSIKHEFAGKKTTTADNKSTEGIQTKSPLSNVKLPSKESMRVRK